MSLQRDEIECPFGHDRGHASPTFSSGDAYTVHVRLGDARKHRHRLGDLCGRHIFALPAKCIADAVNEIVVPAVVLAHQIAGAEPSIAALEYVPHNLLLGCGCIGVPLKSRTKVQCTVEEFSDG